MFIYLPFSLSLAQAAKRKSSLSPTANMRTSRQAPVLERPSKGMFHNSQLRVSQFALYCLLVVSLGHVSKPTPKQHTHLSCIKQYSVLHSVASRNGPRFMPVMHQVSTQQLKGLPDDKRVCGSGLRMTHNGLLLWSWQFQFSCASSAKRCDNCQISLSITTIASTITRNQSRRDVDVCAGCAHNR